MGKYGDYYAQQCNERKEPVEDEPVGMLCSMPTAVCPKCKAEQADMDGFGVLYCEACGYCLHPTVADGKCELCGRDESQPGEKP